MGKNTKLAYATLLAPLSACLIGSAAHAKLPVDQVEAVERVAAVNEAVQRLTFLNMPTEQGAGSLIAPTAAPVRKTQTDKDLEADALRLGGILPVPNPSGASQTVEEGTALRAPTEAVAAVGSSSAFDMGADPNMGPLDDGFVTGDSPKRGFSHRNHNSNGDVQTLVPDDRTRLKKIAVPLNRDPDPQGLPKDNS